MTLFASQCFRTFNSMNANSAIRHRFPRLLNPRVILVDRIAGITFQNVGVNGNFGLVR